MWDHLAVWLRGTFWPCGCVSTSKPFSRVGTIGRVGPFDRVGPSSHVGQFGRVELSSLVELFSSVPTLKGWFGYLAACVGSGLSRLHGRFPVLIGSLNQCKFLVV